MQKCTMDTIHWCASPYILPLFISFYCYIIIAKVLFFKYLYQEEAEKLRAASAKYGGGGSVDTNNGSSKRRRATVFEETQMPMKLIKFGTNVDLSDEIKFK